MRELTERELKIVKLHDTDGLSFRVIGERFGITNGRVSQIYHNALRLQREVRRIEFYTEENQKTVPFELTLGEVVVLDRILSAYRFSEEGCVQHSIKNSNWAALKTENIDYIAAGQLIHRLRDTNWRYRMPFKDLDE